MEIVNWPLLRNPLNWVIVFLMLAIGVAALGLLRDSSSALRSAALPGSPAAGS